MSNYKGPLLERWLGKVEQTDGCWFWRGATTNGYGVLQRGGRGQGLIRAHVFAYTHFVGPIPDGLEIRHRCHVRHCVNPDHLTVGTRSDNMQDMIQAGRGRWRGLPGEQNHRHKLTEEQVSTIRNDQRLLREVAADYDVSMALISNIRRRKAWQHLP